MNLLKEFRPAFLFLGKFLGFYLAANLCYGVFVESYQARPDPITRIVTRQSAWLLNVAGYRVSTKDDGAQPRVSMITQDKIILNVFEGCNGINVMIVFVAFLVAFGGPVRNLILYILFGAVIIHVFNLFRIFLLFHAAIEATQFFYYFHKYLFTTVLYVVVFSLWVLWVLKLHGKKTIAENSELAKN
jgi:exosortase family protein XrtF